MSTAAHNAHKEQVVQDHLIARLVAGEGYELRDAKADYDRALAMDRALILRFVQNTQCARPTVRSLNDHRQLQAAQLLRRASWENSANWRHYQATREKE